jgi:hypothetical protein
MSTVNACVRACVWEGEVPLDMARYREGRGALPRQSLPTRSPLQEEPLTAPEGVYRTMRIVIRCVAVSVCERERQKERN